MTDLTFDEVALSTAVPSCFVRKVTRTMLGARRDQYQDLPGRPGSAFFGEQPGDRRILVDVSILADSPEDRRSACRDLAAWVDAAGIAQLVVDDEDDRYWQARLAVAPEPDEWMSFAEFTLEFRAGPYAFALDPSEESWSASNAVPHTFTIDDELDAPPVVEITCDEAMPDGFTLTVNGLELTDGDTLAEDDVITVSGISYTVSTGPNGDTELDGIFEPETIAMANVDGDFPLLSPGENVITLEGGDAHITATWRRRYR